MSKPIPKTTSARKSAFPTPTESSQPTIPVKWLFTAVGIAIAVALACTWGALCFMFWQGSWQLLYHPASTVTRTPANASLVFDNVEFAPSQAGVPQLRGWWIPAGEQSRFTAIFLHGSKGNLSDTVDALVRLHAAKLNVLAFDYRGYGQSKFVHPNEAYVREDAESAIAYLKDTRHISSGSVVLVGNGLGANLALQVAANHPELAGVILEDPLEAPADAILRDPRARLVPAHLLAKDRWNSSTPALSLRIPSLWIYRQPIGSAQGTNRRPEAFDRVTSRKVIVWLTRPETEEGDYTDALARWLDDLPTRK
jgi:pimeloyl-ACP methyl ester carboxylesterase